MKKLFCILSLALGLLSMIFGAIYIVMALMDLYEKFTTEKQAALEKLRNYIAKKMEVVEVSAQDVVVKE
ncbi:MAG: hypothetical protein FWC66_02520 [Oscillospiraceae bacterium]|nr:hypothetical protein [Oscillospiraceae bacterium]